LVIKDGARDSRLPVILVHERGEGHRVGIVCGGSRERVEVLGG
jgi:hypothetical protein